jgi:hypothetical protein
MSNLKISQLPEFTGNTSGSYLVMNNSGETTTYKVKKENYVFPYNGDATITGSLNSTTGSLKFKVAETAPGLSFLILENSVTSSAIISSGSRAAYVTCKSSNNDSIILTATSGSGVRISDQQNGVEKVILSVGTNVSGNNPPVKFVRDVQISGSLSLNGGNKAIYFTSGSSNSLTGAYISYDPTASGAGGTLVVNTSGSVPNIGSVQISAGKVFSTYNSNTGNATHFASASLKLQSSNKIEMTGNVDITGSLNVSSLINTAPLYIGTGSIYSGSTSNVSGSYGDIRMMYNDDGYRQLYAWAGTPPGDWNALI